MRSSTLFQKLHAKECQNSHIYFFYSPFGRYGSRVSDKGAVRFPLSLARRISVTTDVIVCDDLSHDVIIGLDVLIRTRAIIDIHSQTVLFRSPDPSVPPEEAFFVTTRTP